MNTSCEDLPFLGDELVPVEQRTSGAEGEGESLAAAVGLGEAPGGDGVPLREALRQRLQHGLETGAIDEWLRTSRAAATADARMTR